MFTHVYHFQIALHMVHKHKFKKLNDRQLWNRIRNGDKDCLSILFNRFYSRLFSFGYKIIPRGEFIEDCIQELFLTIWEYRRNVSDAQSVSSYLYVSMRRLVLYNLRKVKNNKTRNSLYMEELIEETPNIETCIILKEYDIEFRRELHDAMHNLTNRQKEIIRLKYSEGLSNSEIARLLEIKRQSVYNHVSEAIKLLKTFVSETSSTTYREIHPK